MVKNLPAMQEPRFDRSLGQGRSRGDERGNPLQYSCLGNLMDRGAWQVTVHGGRIPDTGVPGGLLSMGSHRVGLDWSDLAEAAAKLK